MTKLIFCKQAYILDEIRLNMSYDKMTYKQFVQQCVTSTVATGRKSVMARRCTPTYTVTFRVGYIP